MDTNTLVDLDNWRWIVITTTSSADQPAVTLMAVSSCYFRGKLAKHVIYKEKCELILDSCMHGHNFTSGLVCICIQS